MPQDIVMSEDAHVIDLIPAFALNCLDETEASVVAQHLETCSACQAELLAYQDVAGQLTMAAPDADPPVALKQRLLTNLHREEERTAIRSKTAVSPPHPSSWQQFLTYLNRFFSQPAWQVAALLLIVALGIGNLVLWQRANQPDAQPTPALQVYNLEGTDNAPGASGLIVMSVNGRNGTLIVENLPALSQAQQYQLWLIDDDGQRTSGSVFSVSADGYSVLDIESARSLFDYPAFGITVEPAGGSPAPTGQRVLGSGL
jgi:anti-sigma-K factor RskA